MLLSSFDTQQILFFFCFKHLKLLATMMMMTTIMMIELPLKIEEVFFRF